MWSSGEVVCNVQYTRGLPGSSPGRRDPGPGSKMDLNSSAVGAHARDPQNELEVPAKINEIKPIVGHITFVHLVVSSFFALFCFTN